MKLGDLINKEIFKDISYVKNQPKSIETLLKKHNLNFDEFKFIIRSLNIHISNNIFKIIPENIYQKISNFLEKNEDKKGLVLNEKISDELYVNLMQIDELKRVYEINPFKAFQMYKDSLKRSNVSLNSKKIADNFDEILKS